MMLVFIGLVFVGLAAILFGKKDDTAKNPILGDALVIAAQVSLHVEVRVCDNFMIFFFW